MTHLSEFERKAWNSRSNSDDHKPVIALKAALDDIESGLDSPRHVLVLLWGKGDDAGDTGFKYHQSGPLSRLETEAAIGRLLSFMRGRD